MQVGRLGEYVDGVFGVDEWAVAASSRTRAGPSRARAAAGRVGPDFARGPGVRADLPLGRASAS